MSVPTENNISVQEYDKIERSGYGNEENMPP